MFNHAPKEYICPICIALKGEENKNTLVRKSDIFYKDDLVTAFIASFFIGKNPGHVIIVPNNHFENIYELPNTYASRISEVSKKIALAMKKAYLAEGITTLQNNEPAGNQHAFHYHFHVFPRYKNDDLHKNLLVKKVTSPEEREPYAKKMKFAIEQQ